MKRAGVVAAVLGLLCLLLGGCVAQTPPPPGLTAAQRASATKADLAIRWSRVHGGDISFERPRVAIVKYITYVDAAKYLDACMNKAGYHDVSWSFTTGVVDNDVKPENRFPVEVAIYVCDAKYPTDPIELGYLNDAQEQFLYSYWSDQTVPCLRAHGAAVKNLASVGSFGEGYQIVGSLNPYLNAHFPAGINQNYLMAVCPPYPGQLYGTTD